MRCGNEFGYQIEACADQGTNDKEPKFQFVSFKEGDPNDDSDTKQKNIYGDGAKLGVIDRRRSKYHRYLNDKQGSVDISSSICRFTLNHGCNILQ